MRTLPVSSPVTPRMRGLTIFAGLAVLSAFVLLFFLGERTHDLFAWTIHPPAAAAFLGAGYGSIVVSSILSLRARAWGEIRIPVAVLIIGLVFILLATLLHLDRFHFARAEFIPRNVAIGWMVLYGSIPPLLLWGVIGQLRAGAHIRPNRHPFSGWVKTGFAIIAFFTGVIGLGLFLAPSAVAPFWFWSLTPLLARMTASWVLGVSSAALLLLLDNNVGRNRISAVTLMTYVGLQAIVLIRYAAVVNWAMPMAWLWVGLLALTLIVNLWVWMESQPIVMLSALEDGTASKGMARK